MARLRQWVVHPSGILGAVVILGLLVSGGAFTAQNDGTAGSSGKGQEDLIARGKYLVHHVAQCIQCHTPRDRQGNLIESRLLTGAPIPVDGPDYAEPWAAESASIAGLGNYEPSYVFYLLTHGRKPNGTKPKAPMPTFRLSDTDARAVIAYLRSL